VPLAETIVHTREATVKSAKSAVKRSGVKRTGVKAAAMEPGASVEAPTMEPGASVEAPASTMPRSMGEIRLAERSSEQQSTCDSSQNPCYPGPGSMFAYSMFA
jgi:hypothetical protein